MAGRRPAKVMVARLEASRRGEAPLDLCASMVAGVRKHRRKWLPGLQASKGKETPGEPAVMTAAVFGSHSEVAANAMDGLGSARKRRTREASWKTPRSRAQHRTTKGEERTHELLHALPMSSNARQTTREVGRRRLRACAWSLRVTTRRRSARKQVNALKGKAAGRSLAVPSQVSTSVHGTDRAQVE